MSQPEKRRATAQKAIIQDALASENRFVSAQQLHSTLTAAGHGVGLATVYRQLRRLSEDGVVDIIHVKGEALYRECVPQQHHHHLLCINCGRASDIDFPYETWIDATAQQDNFEVSGHTVEIFGLCAVCQAGQK